MKTSKNTLIGALALLTVISTGVAWQSYWKARWLEAAQLEDEDVAALQRRLTEAERRAQSLQALLDARSETPADAAPAAKSDTSADDRGFGRGRGGPPAAVREVMDRPEMQRLRTLQQRAALDTRYAPLFKSLNLDAPKLDRFKTLLAERESTMQDVMMAARDQGLDPRANRDEIRALVASAQSAVDSELKSLLGDEAYAQYDQFAKTGPQRATVEQLRQSLSYTSDPLTDTQAAQLVNILAANAPASADGAASTPPDNGFGGRGGRGPGGGGPPGTATAPITTAAVAQAQTVLTSTQVQALQQMQTLQQAQQQAMQAIRAAESGGSAGLAANAGSRGRG